ncbi:adenosine deaminase-like protein isoform X1 [Daphnia carinata]|uniref:adenosine deaminase-like protein isoform X1 n=1 Tax=Daphnia carinata TaxID=120202 RepID=UPI00257CECE1|nr:adenosine deaminase-like protein isoform X1 [Daphnia carinata]
MENNMDDFQIVFSMPKAELHAHLNGSLSQATIKKLMDLKTSHLCEDVYQLQTMFAKLSEDHNKTLDECFQVFKIIHQLTDSEESIYIATVDVIKEFSEENVLYLELRTTPREIGGSFETYVSAVIRAIDDCRKENVPILVKLLLSIDRSKGFDIAKQIVDLTISLGHTRNDVVVGLDVSGNMANSDITDYFPLLYKIKDAGLKLTVHTAEVRNDAEAEAILRLKPDRIGHGTFISPSLTGSSHLIHLLKETTIPVELCLTSNKVCKTVPSFKDHHWKVFFDHGIPFSICTDDKGVFSTSLSQEYLILMHTFNLPLSLIWSFSLRSLAYTFAAESENTYLRKVWDKWEQNNTGLMSNAEKKNNFM